MAVRELGFRRGILAAAGWLAAVVAAAPSAATELHFLTHHLAPFTTGADAAPTGLAVDIVRELMRRTGDSGPITVTSLPRVLEGVHEGTDTVGFIIARTPEREATMQWVGPITVSGVYIYQTAGARRLRTLDELRRLERIAVQRGNADDVYLTRLGFTNLDRSYQQVETLGLLLKGRVSATPMSELVFPSLVAQARLRLSDFARTTIKLYDSRVFLAFSKHIDEAVVQAWSAALAELKASGRYTEILNADRPID
jgi:polar amino acid transport system substrate-binding protein